MWILWSCLVFRPNIQKIKKIQTEIFDKPVATPVNKNVEEHSNNL